MKCWNKLLVAIVFTVALTQAAAILAVDYELILLEPSGFDIHRTEVGDIDELGNVVGEVSAYVTGTERINFGFFYSLALDQYWFTEPDVRLRGMNNLQQFVGDFDDNDLVYLGQYWSAPGAASQLLPPLPGDLYSGAGGINDAGLVVGWSSGELTPTFTPVVWQVTEAGISGPLPLPLLAGHAMGEALNIGPSNANGVAGIVGNSGNFWYGEDQVAVSWTVKLKSNGTLLLKEGPRDLGSLGKGPNAALDVNVSRYSVGESGSLAFKKSKNGSMRALKKLKLNGTSATRGAAFGINQQKDIVGWQVHDNEGHAVLWAGGKKLIALENHVDIPSRDRLISAQGINNAGEIIVYHQHRLGRIRAGILIPID